MFLLLMPIFAAPLEAFAAFGELSIPECVISKLISSIHVGGCANVLSHSPI